MMYFLNEDKTYRECQTEEWAHQFERIDRQVAYDVVNEKQVSTVWLGLDNNYNPWGGNPLLLETMVFIPGCGGGIYMDRYTTWDEAVEGHKKAIQWVLDGCKDDE